MAKMDVEWMAKNRDRILAEWSKRYRRQVGAEGQVTREARHPSIARDLFRDGKDPSAFGLGMTAMSLLEVRNLTSATATSLP